LNFAGVEEEGDIFKTIIPLVAKIQLKKTVEKTVEKIIEIMSKNPKITMKELAVIVGLSRRGVE
jgi:predicted HTH transcriptional regulator